MARKEKKYHYIYKITCLKNNRYYIGMHSTDNLEDGYFGGGKRIKNSVKKHGKDAHRKEILEFFENRDLLRQREVELVNEELLNDPMCMNIKLGGEGWCCLGIRIGGDGWKNANLLWDNPNYKIKMSDLSKKRWENPDFKNNIRQKNKGRKTWLNKKHKEETKKIIGEKNSKNQKGEKNSQFGTLWVFNPIEKISKKINKNEFEEFIKKGYRRGRS